MLESAHALQSAEVVTERTTKLDFDWIDPTVQNEATTLLQKLQPSLKRSFTASLEEDVMKSWPALPVLRAYSLEWSFLSSARDLDEESTALSRSKHVGRFDLKAHDADDAIDAPRSIVKSRSEDLSIRTVVQIISGH
jgi:hypothetical protein